MYLCINYVFLFKVLDFILTMLLKAENKNKKQSTLEIIKIYYTA